MIVNGNNLILIYDIVGLSVLRCFDNSKLLALETGVERRESGGMHICV